MAKKQFKTDSKRILDLMINSIYTHKEIFLRELISNASDAMDKLAYKALTDDKVGVDRSQMQITLIPDRSARTLTIRDNGVGMTKEELEANLGTIAKSGSLQFKKEMAENINANLEALGFRNAGVDIRPNLVVLNSTRMPALLVEAGFIDSDKDNQLFDSRFQAMAQAIADGIMETLEEPPVAAVPDPPSADDMSMTGQPEETSVPAEELYRVQAGAYRERENAENLLSLLENDGFPAYIICHDGLYKVQIGAYARLSNAIAMEREVREKGYNTYITTY